MERIPLSRRLEALGCLPARPFAETGGGCPEPISLARRLEALGGSRKSVFIGFNAYFHGIGVLCRSPEPDRKADELARQFKIPPNMRLSALVRYAFSLSDDFPDWEADGNNLLYTLLIEPFSLLGCLPKGGRLNLPEPEGWDDLPF